MHIITQYLLTLVVAICTAASLTDEDIAKILDDTSRGDALSNLDQYDTNLQIASLRDKLRTLEGLESDTGDLYPAQESGLLGDAVQAKQNRIASPNRRRTTNPQQNGSPSIDQSSRVLKPGSPDLDQIQSNVYPGVCYLFCSQRDMKFVTIDQLEMCKILKCFDRQIGPFCTGNKCLESKAKLHHTRYGNNLPHHAATRSNIADQRVRDILESDTVIRHLSDLVNRGCLCFPCNSNCY